MEIKGTIYKLFDLELVNDRFQKRVVVVSVKDGEYEQKIPIQFTQARCDLLHASKVGDLVTIGINIRGSEWQGKFFANIEGWRITTEGASQPQNEPNIEDAAPLYKPEEKETDLPF